MPVPTPRFRVKNETPREFPKLTCFTVMEFRDGNWMYYLIDHLPVSRPTLAEAQDLVDRLACSEDISAEQKRGPGTKWWASR